MWRNTTLTKPAETDPVMLDTKSRLLCRYEGPAEQQEESQAGYVPPDTSLQDYNSTDAP